MPLEPYERRLVDAYVAQVIAEERGYKDTCLSVAALVDIAVHYAVVGISNKALEVWMRYTLSTGHPDSVI